MSVPIVVSSGFIIAPVRVVVDERKRDFFQNERFFLGGGPFHRPVRPFVGQIFKRRVGIRGDDGARASAHALKNETGGIKTVQKRFFQQRRFQNVVLRLDRVDPVRIDPFRIPAEQGVDRPDDKTRIVAEFLNDSRNGPFQFPFRLCEFRRQVHFKRIAVVRDSGKIGSRPHQRRHYMTQNHHHPEPVAELDGPFVQRFQYESVEVHFLQCGQHVDESLFAERGVTELAAFEHQADFGAVEIEIAAAECKFPEPEFIRQFIQHSAGFIPDIQTERIELGILRTPAYRIVPYSGNGDPLRGSRFQNDFPFRQSEHSLFAVVHRGSDKQSPVAPAPVGEFRVGGDRFFLHGGQNTQIPAGKFRRENMKPDVIRNAGTVVPAVPPDGAHAGLTELPEFSVRLFER